VKRSAVTVAQQFRWHTAVELAFDFLRRVNTGLTMSTSEVTDACEWSQCGCLSTVKLAPHHVVVGQSPDR
jgi:hypothetical protein